MSQLTPSGGLLRVQLAVSITTITNKMTLLKKGVGAFLVGDENPKTRFFAPKSHK